jgi:DNA-binding CsgD family transcriptional regulator
MMAASKHASVVAEIRHLSGLGLPGHEVIPELLRHLHDLIPSFTNLFDWVDAEGRIVDYYTEPPYLPEVARRYFDEYYNPRERDVLPPYPAQTRGARGVIRRRLPLGFYESDFYREIWRPRGVHHCLEAVVRDRERPLGVIVLYRGESDPDFTRDEARILEDLLPYFARAIKGPAAWRGARAAAARAALLVSDERGEIRNADRQGRLWLALALHPCLNRRTCGAQCSRADEGISVRLAALCRELQCSLSRTATLQLTNQWGRFSLHAHWLEPTAADGERLIGITVEHEVPLPVAIGAALDVSSLSPRQRELCLLLAEGLTYAEIGERMGISEQTAISYARVVFQKQGAHGREELLRGLLFRPRRGNERPITPDLG